MSKGSEALIPEIGDQDLESVLQKAATDALENMNICTSFINLEEKVVIVVDVTKELHFGSEFELSFQTDAPVPDDRQTNGIADDQTSSNKSQKRKACELQEDTNHEDMKKNRLGKKLRKKKCS